MEKELIFCVGVANGGQTQGNWRYIRDGILIDPKVLWKVCIHSHTNIFPKISMILYPFNFYIFISSFGHKKIYANSQLPGFFLLCLNVSYLINVIPSPLPKQKKHKMKKQNILNIGNCDISVQFMVENCMISIELYTQSANPIHLSCFHIGWPLYIRISVPFYVCLFVLHICLYCFQVIPFFLKNTIPKKIKQKQK